MSNDLISKNEVKKLGATCLARRNEDGQLEAIISLDLAPTVEERLKGEWKHEVIGDKCCVLCNSCKLHFDCETNFCPNCGADMRGGTT